LSSVLSDQETLDAAIHRQAVGQGNGAALDVIFAGALPPNPDELVESESMREILRATEERYDLVVIDTPPTAVVADAIPLIKEVSGVLVVGRLEKTTRDAAQHLAQQLSNLEARVLGIVVNGVSRSSAYGYGYGPDVSRNGAVPARDAEAAVATDPVSAGAEPPGKG
jgi:capsular exopolysaccharide synthesis family protein